MEALILTSIMDYMNFINKYFLFVLVLTGCSSFNSPYLTLLYDSIKTDSVDIQYLSNNEFSSAEVIYDGSVYLFILSSYNNGLETWVGPSNETFVIKNGLILATFGFKNDYSFNGTGELSLKDGSSRDYEGWVSLTSPKVLFSKAFFTKIAEETSSDCPHLLKFRRSLPSLKKSDILEICFDDSIVKYSTQKTDPLSEDIKIRFFYKY